MATNCAAEERSTIGSSPKLALLVLGGLLVGGNPKVDRCAHGSSPLHLMYDFDANRPIKAMSVFGGFLYSRIAQPPQPRPADRVSAADRLRDLAQDAAHTPPMPTRNALAVSSM
jgi:hypothetical protein